MEDNVRKNPFEVPNVPDAYDPDVAAFAEKAAFDGIPADENAKNWPGALDGSYATIEGPWESRWNGAADPTIAGDSADQWKRGHGELRIANGRVYLAFDWKAGARKGLIEARFEGDNRLVGKYINLTDSSIQRPWVGLIVGNNRIDGRFPEGRLDFRR